jgi:hypothetical protein
MTPCARLTDALPFLVVVDGKRDAMPWRRYPSYDAAEQSAKKLRLLGMAARVIRDDDAKEELANAVSKFGSQGEV